MPRPRAFWIRLDDGVHDHPKTIGVSLALKITREQATGHMTRLWLWALKYRPAGTMAGLSDEMVAEASGWRGSAAEWVATLREVGFIKARNRGRGHVEILSGWHERNGRQLAERSRSRNRAGAATDACTRVLPPSDGAAPHFGASDGQECESATGATVVSRTNPAELPHKSRSSTALRTDVPDVPDPHPQKRDHSQAPEESATARTRERGRLSALPPGNGNGDRRKESRLDTSDDAVEKAREYRLQLCGTASRIPELAGILPLLEALQPRGTWRDSRAPVLATSDRAREKIKAVWGAVLGPDAADELVIVGNESPQWDGLQGVGVARA